MTTYVLFYNATDKVATLKASGASAGTNEVEVKTFTHDSDTDKQDVLYEHVRLALDYIGVYDMAYVKLVDEVDESA